MKLGCPTPEEIERLAEAKASRDVLSHNRGVANRVYGQKAGRLARFEDGQRIEIDGPYFRAAWELLLKIADDVCGAALGKVP